MLLLLKLLVAPGLVAAVTLAVRRWGPAIGGWLSGMPVVAGPVLIFIAFEQGSAFGAQAAHATLAGLIGTAAFTVAYARSAERLTWWGSLLAGWATFAVTASILYVTAPSLIASLACSTWGRSNHRVRRSLREVDHRLRVFLFRTRRDAQSDGHRAGVAVGACGTGHGQWVHASGIPARSIV
jgi:hypothetical protein